MLPLLQTSRNFTAEAAYSEAPGVLNNLAGFMANNIAYILLAAAVVYVVVFVLMIVHSRCTGEGFRFSLRQMIGFLLILGVAVYCLATGQSFSEFIG